MNPAIDDSETRMLNRNEQLRLLLSTCSSVDIAQLLAGTDFADGGSVAILPAPSNTEDAWKERAAAYGSQYPGAEHWRRFCSVLAATGSIPFAAKQVGKTVNKIQDRRDRFPEFAQHVQHAIDFFNSAVLERAAFVRAIDGVIEPVFNKGVIVGYIRRFSDALMNKLLEGNIPDKYKPRALIETNNTFHVEGGLPAMPIENNPHRTIEHAPIPVDPPQLVPPAE